MMTSVTIKKLAVAMTAMRKPDTRLVQTNCNGRPDFWIAPSGGRVEPAIAKQIIAHPQVVGGKDALFPGLDQTWRMRRDDVGGGVTESSAIPSQPRTPPMRRLNRGGGNDSQKRAKSQKCP